MRTALRTIILAIREAWSPTTALFGNGEVGVFYDPSDFSTLYQDAAGTTPVTAVEQPVGLMLDKSRGLVLGAELVTNGDFSNGTTGFEAVLSTIAVVSGELQVTGSSGTGRASQNLIPTTAGKTYKVLFTARNGTGTVPSFYVYNTSDNSQLFTQAFSNTSNANFTGVFTATGSSVYIWCRSGVGITYFDNISVRELPGNHASQSTSTKRPVLSQRYNLLTKSNLPGGISDWSTTGGASLTSATLSGWVNGITTGASFANGGGFAYLYTGAAYSAPASTQLILSCDVRMNDGGAPAFSSTAALNDFDITIKGDNVAVADKTVTLISGTIYRVTGKLTTAAGTAGNNGIFVQATSSGRGFSVTAFQIVPADQASLPYQRVDTATVYDSDATKFRPFLRWDGVDDSMSTGSIDFTSGGKMFVGAAVRKLSDAARGMVCELSATYANVGSFGIEAPDTSLNDLSVALNNASIISKTYVVAAPTTKVFTAQLQASASAGIELKINGVSTGAASGNSGASNFGNYPLYLGSRAGTSSPFNGQMYGLIIRAAANTTAQTQASETYLAGKAGITL